MKIIDYSCKTADIKMKEKECSRCGEKIECNPDDILNCACNQVNLSPESRAYLKQTSYNCLCNTCLNEVNQLTEQAKRLPTPKGSTNLLPNIHYYMENGNFVFTEFYHIQKGYCCKNNCRHCAYGFNESE